MSLLFAQHPWLEGGSVQMHKGQKATTYLDLFYDLVLIVAIETIGADFRQKLLLDPTFSAAPILDTFAFLLPVWLHALALCGYTNRFGKVDHHFTLLYYFLNFLCTYILILLCSVLTVRRLGHSHC